MWTFIGILLIIVLAPVAWAVISELSPALAEVLFTLLWWAVLAMTAFMALTIFKACNGG